MDLSIADHICSKKKKRKKVNVSIHLTKGIVRPVI